jgi:uncharacterized protein YcbK (DUF882 family)
MRWSAFLIATTLVAATSGAVADPAPAKPAPAPAKAAPAKAAPAKAAPAKAAPAKAKVAAKAKSTFTGHNATTSELRKDPLPKPSGDVWVRAVNISSEVRVNIYKPDGTFDDESLAMLDEVFRCPATGEVRAVNAYLYEHLSRLNDHFTGKPVELYSGFRFAERSSSRHHHASAMDIKVPGVSAYELQKFAFTLDQGKDGPHGGMGIGIYPNSGFVHVDFRAPGEPSFRWTDWSGGKKAPAKKAPGRTQPARKPTS